jgi:hypothetical protein
MSNKKNRKSSGADDGMLPEYDLSNRTGERGRYYDALQQGYSVHIHEDDGTTTIQHYKLADEFDTNLPPITRSLVGILDQCGFDADEYRRYQENKYK